MTIRDAQAKDTASMLEIYAPFILESVISFELEVPSEKQFRQRVIDYSQEYPWLVAEVGGKVVGYAYSNAHRSRAAYQWSAEVSVYLAQNFRGKDVAQSLYYSLFNILKKQNIRSVFAGMTYPNPPSAKFHEGMGFQEIAKYRHVGYKFGQWHSTVWYQLEFDQSEGDPEPFIPYVQLDGDI